MSLTIESKHPVFTAGAEVKALIPQTFEEVYRLARLVVASGMAPKGMDTEERAAIAIIRGLELGLTPFQALDKIAVVNGRPTLWGDGALGLVRGSGLVEWIEERIEEEGDKRFAICAAKRRGDEKIILRRFSVVDAKKAGLWGKAGPWQQYPDRMLQMRARAFCLRDGFADVLGGLYLKEEFDGIEGHARDVTPTPPVPPPPPGNLGIAQPVELRTVNAPVAGSNPAPQASATRKQLEASVAQIEAEKSGGFDFDAYRAVLKAVQSNAEADAVWRQFVENANRITEEETEEAQKILNEATARFWKDEP